MRAISAVVMEDIAALHDPRPFRIKGAEGIVFRIILSGDEEHTSSWCGPGQDGKVFRKDEAYTSG
jgi:hypothetical protein